MSSIRRLYIFLVCAISLNALTWAVITLTRHLIAPLGFTPTSTIAFQIAVIIAGLPIYLVHWLWAQRAAAREAEERTSTLRYLYLFGMLAAFVVPFIVNAAALVETGLQASFGILQDDAFRLILRNVIALIPLALQWFYHTQIIRRADAPLHGERGTLQRLYVLAFSAVGVALVTIAAIDILRLILFQFGRSDVIASNINQIVGDVSNLVVGLPLWLIFWRWAQRLFDSNREEERHSALRKLYLYAIVFVSVVTVVSNATLLLSGILQRLLGLSPDGDWRNHLPLIIGAGVLWAYHSTILRKDAAQHVEAATQARVRRAYLYLVATIGLLALVGGVGGNISVLIRSLADVIFDTSLREQVAWFTAALIAGLPVWLIPWRQAQLAATDPANDEERYAIIRKAYLYFFLFLATLAVLSGVVYILWRLISLLLGEQPDENLAVGLAHAIAFALLGVAVWLYHGAALRADGQLSSADQAQRLAQLGVVVVDVDGFGAALYAALQQELPKGKITLQTLPSDDDSALAEAGLLIGAHTLLAFPAVANSPARKLFVPLQGENWEWVGVERHTLAETIAQTVRAVKQIIVGEVVNINPARQLGAIVVAIIGGFFLLAIVVGLIVNMLFSL
jgi:hypothetical protein